MSRQMIIEIICTLLILLFVYTAISKLSDYQNFKAVLATSPLLKPYAGVLAWALPVTEIIAGTFLFFPLTRSKGLLISFVLLIIFTVYLVYMVLFTPNLPCNCGGVISRLTWGQHIFFNLFFLLLSITGILLSWKNKKVNYSVPP